MRVWQSLCWQYRSPAMQCLDALIFRIGRAVFSRGFGGLSSQLCIVTERNSSVNPSNKYRRRDSVGGTTHLSSDMPISISSSKDSPAISEISFRVGGFLAIG
jgi:hypothetical protein